jgi:manganese/zinc/iron transport system permease protein
MGLITAGLSAAINRWGRVDEGAALGVVFTGLFAIGVILVNIFARNIDIDPGCVLYGLIEFVPLDTRAIAGIDVPRALISLVITGVLTLGLVALFFKELRIVCFDAALATTLGISATLVHYGLLGAVAAVSVVSFEAVGSILVVAMLVAPAATAQLLTDRLDRMVIYAGVIAALDAAVGHALAIWLDTSVAGMMAAVAGGVFIIAMLTAPRYGLIATWLRRAALAVRIAEEDVLGTLYRAAEAPTLAGARVPDPPPTPGLFRRLALARLRRAGRIADAPGGLTLTPAGAEAARAVIRAHRLWESYLARHAALPLDHLHDPSERIEHFLSPELQGHIERESGGADDPQGKPIPRSRPTQPP